MLRMANATPANIPSTVPIGDMHISTSMPRPSPVPIAIQQATSSPTPVAKPRASPKPFSSFFAIATAAFLIPTGFLGNID